MRKEIETMASVSSKQHSNGTGFNRCNRGLLVAAMVFAAVATIVASAFLFVPQAIAPELPGASVAAR